MTVSYTLNADYVFIFKMNVNIVRAHVNVFAGSEITLPILLNLLPIERNELALNQLI